MDLNRRDLSIQMERVLFETCLWIDVFWPKMGIVKARKLGVRSEIFLFPKIMQGYGNRLADIRLVMQAVGHVEHSISM